MINTVAAVLGRIAHVAQALQLQDLNPLLEDRSLTVEEFAGLVDELVDRIVGDPQIDETAEGGTSQATDADQYLREKAQIADTLQNVVFTSLDKDGNGRLEGEEFDKLEDFLTYFNRRALSVDAAGGGSDPLKTLSEIVEDR